MEDPKTARPTTNVTNNHPLLEQSPFVETIIKKSTPSYPASIVSVILWSLFAALVLLYAMGLCHLSAAGFWTLVVLVLLLAFITLSLAVAEAKR